jgi:primosomal protein N' (replication factor Y)
LLALRNAARILDHRPLVDSQSGAREDLSLDGTLVQVAVGRPVHGRFTYRLPQAWVGKVVPGQRVVVPFANGRAVGFLLSGAADPPPGTLREVAAILDEGPVFNEELLAFLEWTAGYYRYPLGEVLRSALPPGLARPEQAPDPRRGMRSLVSLTDLGRGSRRPRGVAMQAILDYLGAAPGEVDLEELSAAIPGARAPLKRLVAQGLCASRDVSVEPDRPELALAGNGAPLQATKEQRAALAAIETAVAEHCFAPFLLHGVTGSGKTEVYLRAIACALDKARTALVLVPEIALTPQLVGRFRARFGEKVAVLHSGLRDSERLAEWRRLKCGGAPVAVGVRSAIFAPVENLGIVVVDEEHDGSFKQEEKLRYHARDLAVVRARQAGCPVVLGSATPSLESLHNARIGRYRLLELSSRIDDRPMPAVEIVDMRSLAGQGHVSAAFPQLAGKAKVRAAEARRVAGEPFDSGLRPSLRVTGEDGTGRGSSLAVTGDVGTGRGPSLAVIGEVCVDEGPQGPPLLSSELAGALQEVLAKRRQAILFLNRRGTSTYHLCLACGRSLTCESCAVSLIRHGSRGALVCHYCGHSRPLPVTCPDCGGPIESLGMGTERVEQEIANQFPKARLCRLDRDSAGQAEEVTALLSSFARGEKDILIGTQMVAKGHDFPGVTLVGVLLADLALNLPDFRAAERTFQLLTQVAGRAGRGKEPGRVVVQTFNPEAEAVACVLGHDFRAFAEQELRLRKAYHYPPFCRLLSVRIDGPRPQETAEAARQVAQAVAVKVRASRGALRLLGPTPAPISRLRGRSRWQMLVKGPTARSLVPAAEAAEVASRILVGGARATVDIDPLALL